MSNENVHEPAAGTVAPATCAPVAEAMALTVPPAQVVEALGTCATNRPLGSSSRSATPVKACVALGLVMVMVRRLGVPGATGEVAKALASVGACSTCSVALGPGCGFVTAPSLAITVPPGMVLT